MKDFLKENKIYFELASSIMFGIAALLISLASYNISREQLNASKLNNNPHFYIETELQKDEKTKMYTDKILKVYNAGAPVYNLNISHYEFIEVRYFGEKQEIIYVPVNGYYSGQFLTHSPTGLLSTFRGYKNNSIMGKLDHSSLEYTKKSDDYFELQFKNIISISYTGRDEEQNTVYFFNRNHVSKDFVEGMINANKNIQLIDIESATVESLIKAAKNIEMNK